MKVAAKKKPVAEELLILGSNNIRLHIKKIIITTYHSACKVKESKQAFGSRATY